LRRNNPLTTTPLPEWRCAFILEIPDSGGPWSALTRWIWGQEQLVKPPLFRTPEELSSILKDAFAIVEDIKVALAEEMSKKS